ncbi:hypothetical protein LLS1_22180 [Leifsonia sp. LS1]|nr:hypothetical protein LLS1_22180 [Leifsonia sp. LS1]
MPRGGVIGEAMRRFFHDGGRDTSRGDGRARTADVDSLRCHPDAVPRPERFGGVPNGPGMSRIRPTTVAMLAARHDGAGNASRDAGADPGQEWRSAPSPEWQPAQGWTRCRRRPGAGRRLRPGGAAPEGRRAASP